MKLSEMILSTIIKRGMICEVRNIDTTFNIPATTKGGEDTIFSINVKADHMTVRIDKEEPLLKYTGCIDKNDIRKVE